MKLKVALSAIVLIALVPVVTLAGTVTPYGYMGLTLAGSSQQSVLRTNSSQEVTLTTAHGTSTAQIWQGGAFTWDSAVYVKNTTPLTFIDPAPVSGLPPQQILTFCIDFTEDINWGGQYGYGNTLSKVNDSIEVIPVSAAPIESSGNIGTLSNNPSVPGPTNGMGQLAATLMEELWKKYFDGQIQADLTAYNTAAPSNKSADLATVQNDVAAFQLALWKIEYDVQNFHFDGSTHLLTSGYSFTSGEVTTTSAANSNITKTAENWLKTLTNNPKSTDLACLVAISGVNFQDQLAEVTAPEPGSVIIWLTIGSVLAFPCLRRRTGLASAASP